MKKIYLLAALLLGSMFSSQAQDDPESRFLFSNLWSPIVVHDSIAYYSDTSAGATPDYITEFVFFSDGNIDTATSYNYPSMVSEAYSGKQTGNTTEVAYFDLYSGTPDTLAKYVIIKDNNSRDSAMQIFYEDSTGSLSMQQEYRASYNANSTLDRLELFIDNGAGQFERTSSYVFYYTGTRLDSMMAELDFFGMTLPVAVFDNQYDANDKLLSSDIIALDPFSGKRAIENRIEFGHNSADEINEVFVSYYDSTASAWVLEENWEYLSRSNTSSVDENITLSEIYPNPVKDVLHISGAEYFNSYEVIRSNGQVVQTGAISEKLDLSTLPGGFYILRLAGEKGTEIKKIQKF